MRDWNLYMMILKIKKEDGLYLTYEGLKPTSEQMTNSKWRSFVSYLWGIETQIAHNWFPPWICVCILPMRDWNRWVFKKWKKISKWFVSYLWGIETCIWWYWKLRRRRFVSYLWGIETQKEPDTGGKRREVCILPMRDWNFEKPSSI